MRAAVHRLEDISVALAVTVVDPRQDLAGAFGVVEECECGEHVQLRAPAKKCFDLGVRFSAPDATTAHRLDAGCFERESAKAGNCAARDLFRKLLGANERAGVIEVPLDGVTVMTARQSSQASESDTAD